MTLASEAADDDGDDGEDDDGDDDGDDDDDDEDDDDEDDDDDDDDDGEDDDDDDDDDDEDDDDDDEDDDDDDDDDDDEDDATVEWVSVCGCVWLLNSRGCERPCCCGRGCVSLKASPEEPLLSFAPLRFVSLGLPFRSSFMPINPSRPLLTNFFAALLRVVSMFFQHA